MMKLKNKIERAYGKLSILKNGFWFIDIPRTSSSSIRSELGKHFGKAYGKKNVIEKEHSTPQIFKDHLPAQKIRSRLGRFIWNRIFTFTIVRNPWDRIYSMYNYRKKSGNIPSELSFRDYVLALEKATKTTELFKYPIYRYGASEYVLGENDEIIVDFIAKFENRTRDLNLIASRINLNKLGGLSIQKATPKDTHYSEFYDAETSEIIRRLYSKDIELFEYEFDDKT